RRSRAFGGALALVLAQGAALYLAHSRVAWCAAGLALVVAVIARVRRRPKRASTKDRLGIALAGVFAAGALTAGHASSEGAISNDVPAEVSLAGRMWIAKVTLHAAMEAGPLGEGLGRFGHAFADAQGGELRSLPRAVAARRFVNATTAHDDFLQAAVE